MSFGLPTSIRPHVVPVFVAISTSVSTIVALLPLVTAVPPLPTLLPPLPSIAVVVVVTIIATVTSSVSMLLILPLFVVRVSPPPRVATCALPSQERGDITACQRNGLVVIGGGGVQRYHSHGLVRNALHTFGQYQYPTQEGFGHPVVIKGERERDNSDKNQ